MDLLFSQERRSKFILVSLLALIIILFVGIFRLITGSFIVAILLFLGLLYLLLRLVGVFVMYPGSSAFTRSDIQIRMSKEISQRMVTFFNATYFLSLCVSQNKYLTHQNPFDLTAGILTHVNTMKEVLSMFQSSLSQRKKQMLLNYRTISSIIQEKEENEPSIHDLIHNPRSIDALNEQTCLQLKPKFVRIEQLMKELHSFIKSYSPPQGLFSQIKFKFFQQNLYQIRFAFHTWKLAYNYEISMVNTTDGDQLETYFMQQSSTIIHNELRKTYFVREPINQPNPSKKTVLFCNPNGVFIQFFGYDNEYIRNYLRMGYNVILWNYRGYAQSTGSPSIVKSQIDATHVYNFYRDQGYDIKIVHGYSIGGAAAVGIFERIPEEQIKNIEILIIDRSFSSIGEMSIEFGPALHKLTKLLFFGDNIDLSKQFEVVRCKKLLIWDNLDEVIPDRASFKNRIIKRRRKSSSSNSSMYGFDEDLEVNHLNEDVQTDLLKQESSNPDFENLTNKLVFTIRNLLQLLLSGPTSEERELNTMSLQQKEVSNQTCSTSDKQNQAINHLMKIINEIDGGGIELFIDLHEMKKNLQSRPDKFYHICDSYILGLVCYGSYFPLQPFIYDHQKIKEQTLHKLNRAMKDVQDRFNFDATEPSLLFKKEGNLDQLAKNMYHIYFKLSQLVTDYFSEQWFTNHGSLLPTNNGHNCSLTEAELNILNEFIKSTIPPPLQEKIAKQEELKEQEEPKEVESEQIMF